MNHAFITAEQLPEELLRFVHQLDEVTGIHSILDRVLAEARRLTNAEAGSLFLVERGSLRIAYVQNEALFGREEVPEALYRAFTLPIDKESIAGYVAISGRPLAIKDAYNLPEGVPYRFRGEVDARSGYRTRSALTAPLRGTHGRTIGVLQLINSKGPDGAIGPFSDAHLDLLPLFSQYAAAGIERGTLTDQMVLRMIKMAELRDPTETGAHARRVGAMAAEIHHRWALKRGVAEAERNHFGDLLRVAAMLHDVGKVGISDRVLNKPGPLDAEEFHAMKWHAVLGARLFADRSSELDEMAHEIALNHHERWDGGGYPGHIADIDSNCDPAAPLNLSSIGKRGEEIPLAARITAVADVLDALLSTRIHKQAWSWQRAVETIREEAGRHFDPAVVEAFFEAEEACRAIQERYPDPHPTEQPSLEGRIEAASV